MRDKPPPPGAAFRAVSRGQSLRRIADVLNVPVSSFYEAQADASPEHGRAEQESEAVLAIVRSYVHRADPEARERFLADLRAVVEAPSPWSTSGSAPEDPQDA